MITVWIVVKTLRDKNSYLELHTIASVFSSKARAIREVTTLRELFESPIKRSALNDMAVTVSFVAQEYTLDQSAVVRHD